MKRLYSNKKTLFLLIDLEKTDILLENYNVYVCRVIHFFPSYDNIMNSILVVAIKKMKEGRKQNNSYWD